MTDPSDPSHRSDATLLLRRARAGDKRALDAIVPLIYEELHALAHIRMKKERAGHTLDTTALVHEAYLRLIEIRQVEWRDRAHFMAVASRIMRRILVDYARKRGSLRRGGDWVRVELDTADGPADDPTDGPAEDAAAILELDQALTRLEALSERQSKILEQRFFGGLTLEECAEALGISLTTVKRDLRTARAWLAQELGTET
jgi:RNA polymerase sigma factor (TIGR02999 family)